MNENWFTMTGVHSEIALSKKWWDSIPIDDKPQIEEKWNTSISLYNNFELEIQFSNSKSNVKWALVNITKISSSENKVIGFIGTLTNITKTKSVEENLKKLYLSVEQSPISVVITNNDGEIEYVNTATIDKTGYSKAELIGRNPKILNSGFQNKEFYEKLWKTISSGEVWNGQFYNKKKDGTYYWEQASIAPVFNDKNIITNYVAVKEDITSKKKLEEDLIQAKNIAVKSNQIKSNFLTKINYDLRIPLVGILGCAKAISEKAIDKKIKELSEILIAEGNRLNDILKPILAFSKIETELEDIPIFPVEINSLIKELKSSYDKNNNNNLLAVKVMCNKEEIYVDSNEEMLKDVINYLFSNALKYTQQGEIIVTPNVINEECVISIADTGIGIPDNAKDIIFEPFSQIDGEINQVNKGIGMGLTLAKKYIDIMGGRIWFVSSQGEGTTFFIAIQITKNLRSKVYPAIQEQKSVGTVSTSATKKILIIEDDEINMRITKLYLKGLFNISSAKNAAETIEITKNNKFDIVLTDIGLKNGLSGIELTKLLRTNEDCKNIPIIAVTAYTSDADKEKIFAAGCSHYLSKPFMKEDLINIINTALTT